MDMSESRQGEEARLMALRELQVLDSVPEPEFDAIVKAAAAVCGASISLITLVSHDRQWFKANIGLENVTETPREVAFCDHAIQGEGIFEVRDASTDSRFHENPLVTQDPNIRFYAGAPLRLKCGSHIGTLCVIDDQPRELDSRQKDILQHLSAVVVKALESRQASQALAASEAQFRALSVAAPLGIFSTDADGACNYTNARWRSIFNISDVNALGHGWTSTLHPDDHDEVFSDWRRTALSRSVFDKEFRIQHDDGKVIHVRTISSPIVTGDGDVTGHVGSVEDITERKAQQLSQHKNEKLLAETGALADVGGWEYDLVSSRLHWTDQTCCIHGLPVGYQPSLTEAIEFYAPEAKPVIEAAVNHAIETGQGWDLELPLVRADGKTIWVRSVGHLEYDQNKPTRLYGAFHNVTNLVLQRQALEHANERMNVATQSGNIGVWELDLGSETLSWTAQMYRLYGLSPESTPVDQHSWAQLIHPDDRALTVELTREAVANASGAFDMEFRALWPDGSVHYIRASANITRNADGRATRMLGVNWDVTPLRSISNQLAEQHELLQVTLQSIGDAVITTNAEGRVTWLNPAAEYMTGWVCAQAACKPIDDIFVLIDEDTRQPTPNPVHACLTQAKPVTLSRNSVLVSRNGCEFGIEDSAAPMRSSTGKQLGVVLVFHDVTEQRRLTCEMSYQASHDSLTQLVNRAEFEKRLQTTLDQSTSHNTEHALLFIDLDQFKLVNDACGHAEGDLLLIQMSKLLKETIRSGDTLARLGGDEFGIILQLCDKHTALRIAQTICDRMNVFRFEHNHRRFRIGTSIGLVTLDGRWTDVESAMQAADTGCLAAKEAGRNRVHQWLDTDTAMQARREDMQWATRLEQALDEDRFVLHAQRIENTQTADVSICAEVLIRLRDTDGSLIQPNAFLPAAERFNLATRIDRWVLRNSLNALITLPDITAADTFFINLSGQSVGDTDFHKDAICLLNEAGMEVCKRVCLEITETAAVTNIADATRFIEQVRALGVRVALDDFGSGASSFGYLKTLPVDILKIDGQFITGVIDDPIDGATVRCFMDIAKLMNLKTVAECIETKAVFDHMKLLDTTYMQGFFLHSPEPIEALFPVSRQQIDGLQKPPTAARTKSSRTSPSTTI